MFVALRNLAAYELSQTPLIIQGRFFVMPGQKVGQKAITTKNRRNRLSAVEIVILLVNFVYQLIAEAL